MHPEFFLQFLQKICSTRSLCPISWLTKKILFEDREYMRDKYEYKLSESSCHIPDMLPALCSSSQFIIILQNQVAWSFSMPTRLLFPSSPLLSNEKIILYMLIPPCGVLLDRASASSLAHQSAISALQISEEYCGRQYLPAPASNFLDAQASV